MVKSEVDEGAQKEKKNQKKKSKKGRESLIYLYDTRNTL
jgi:hypothetical protein